MHLALAGRHSPTYWIATSLRLLGFSASLCLAPVAASAQPSPPFYSGEEISGTVTDPETRKPVAGVIVVADWRLVKIFGDPNVRERDPSLVIAETVTDSEGRFSLPAWGPLSLPVPAKGRYRLDPTQPWVHFFKPGYHIQSLNSPTPQFQVFQKDPDWTGDALRKWRPRPVYLHQFKLGDMAYAEHLANSTSFYLRSRCDWTKSPRAIATLLNEGARLGQPSAGPGMLSVEELKDDEQQKPCPDVVATLKPHLSPDALRMATQSQERVASTTKTSSPPAKRGVPSSRPAEDGVIGDADLAQLWERDRIIRGQPSPAAIAAAQRLCADSVKNIAALFVVAQPVFRQCVDSYSLSEVELTPEPIEQLLIRYFGDDRVIPLWRFVGSTSAFKGFPSRSLPRYRSRELFDKMYAEIVAGRSRDQATVHRLLSTDLPGIESEVTDLLARVPVRETNPIVWFLGTRRYGPAVQPLVELASRIRPANGVSSTSRAIDSNLGRIGTLEAKEALIAKVRQLRQQAPGRERDLVLANTLRAFAYLPPDLQPDNAAFAALLPAGASDELKKIHIEFILGRK